MQEIRPPYSCSELSSCATLSSHCEARLLPSALNCVDGFQRETLTFWVLTGDYNGRGFRLGHKVPQVRICAGVNPRASIPFDTEVLGLFTCI